MHHLCLVESSTRIVSALIIVEWKGLNSSNDTHARMDSTIINYHEHLQRGAKNSVSAANLLRETQPTFLDTGHPELDLPTNTVRTIAQILGDDSRTDRFAVLFGKSSVAWPPCP